MIITRPAINAPNPLATYRTQCGGIVRRLGIEAGREDGDQLGLDRSQGDGRGRPRGARR
jgi:hypothetical protein